MSGPSIKSRLEALVKEMVARGIRLEEAVEQFECLFLREMLRRHDGNQSRAADALGIHRNTLRNRLQRHGLL